MSKLLRLFSIILIQAFLLLDLSWAANGNSCSGGADNFLAPAMQVDNAYFRQMLTYLSREQEEKVVSSSRRRFLSLFIPALAEQGAKPDVKVIRPERRHIRYRIFDDKQFYQSDEAGKVVRAVSQFILEYKKLVRKDDDTLEHAEPEDFAQLRMDLADEILGFLNDDLKAKITGGQASSRDAAWAKLMFEILPVYLAQYGVMLNSEFIPVWKKGRPEAMVVLNFELYRVRDIVSFSIDRQGETVSMDELEVIPVESEEGEVISLEVFPPMGKVINGNVTVCMSRIESNAQDFIDQLDQISWEFVKNAREIPWEKYLLLGNKNNLTPLTFAQAKILSSIKKRNPGRKDIIKWLRSRNRYQQALIAMDKSGVCEWNGQKVTDRQVRESAGLKSEARLDYMLYCDEEFIDIELMHLMSITESSEVLPEEIVTKTTVLSNMLDYIEDNIDNFPEIKINRNSSLKPRAQIVGQFYLLSYGQIMDITKHAYSLLRAQRSMIYPVYDISQLYESKDIFAWARKNKQLVGGTAGLVALGAVGIFGWLTARKMAVRRVHDIVLSQVLDTRLSKALRQKISDHEIYELAKVLVKNEFKARIVFEKLLKSKKIKQLIPFSAKTLLKETLNRVDGLSENRSARRELIISELRKRLDEFYLMIERSRKAAKEKKSAKEKKVVTPKKKRSKKAVKTAFAAPEVPVVSVPRKEPLPDAYAGMNMPEVIDHQAARPEYHAPTKQEIKEARLESLLVDKVHAQLERRKGEIDPEAYRTLFEAVTDLQAELKNLNVVMGREYSRIRRQITSLGEAVREEPVLPKKNIAGNGSLAIEHSAQENGSAEPEPAVVEEEPSHKEEYLAEKDKNLADAAQVITELEGQLRLLRKMISLEDEPEPLEVSGAEKTADGIRGVLRSSYAGKIDAYSRILMYVENGASFELKISNGSENNKFLLVPAGSAAEKDKFFALDPEKLKTAKFFLQYSAQSEKIQLQALEQVKNAVEKNSLTGIEVLDYVLRLKAPQKRDYPQFSREAVNDLMLNNRIGLLHGGVGTAKTTALLGAAEEIASRKKKPVLIFAPQHVIADEITLRAGGKGIPVLRCGNAPSKFKKEVQENYSRHSKKAKKEFERRFSALNTQPNENGCILTATVMGGALDWLISILDDPQARVYLRDVTLIIDEAALINYPELIAAVYLLKPKALFLIGDHIQYKPYSLVAKLNSNQRAKFRQEWGRSMRAAIARYEKSVFEQLIGNPLYSQININKNFRSHWIIVELVQDWYRGYFTLESFSRQRGDRLEDDTLEIVDTSSWKDQAYEKQDPVTGSYSNPGEAFWVLEKIKEFLAKTDDDGNSYEAKDITIITPYRKQIELIRSFIEYDPDLSSEDISVLKENVLTSQQIQGGENKITLVSLVRSDDGNGHRKKNGSSRQREFLFDEETIIANPALLLVSLTRAKEKTAVIGNRKTLEALTQDAKSGFARQMYALIFDFGISLKRRIEILEQSEFSVHSTRDIETVDTIVQAI